MIVENSYKELYKNTLADKAKIDDIPEVFLSSSYSKIEYSFYTNKKGVLYSTPIGKNIL